MQPGWACLTPRAGELCGTNAVGLVSYVCALCSWGEDPSTPRVWGSAPDIDRAPKIRTLEKRRDWGNYTSSPVGRLRGNMLIACLAEKCPRRRVKSQAMQVFVFNSCHRFFRAADPMYSLPLCRRWTHTLHNNVLNLC